MEDTRLYYLDQSWGKVEYEYFYAPIVDMATPAASSTAGSIKDDSLAATQALGYHWCGGPCGSNLAAEAYRDPSKASDLNSNYFDMAIIAFRADPPGNLAWAGLGVVGSAFTWTKYPTSAGIMEHEIGHNYGIGHGRTTKVRGSSKLEYNSPQYEGYSRMAAGGSVYADDQRSRFNENGHFSPANKHWYGWLVDRDVVFLHPEGNSFPDCAECRTSWSGKLNAMDRPDVVPGEENSPYFAAKIPIGTTGREVLYVFYRTSYPATRKGVSVQYCDRNFGGDSGMTGTCYTYDAHGASYTLEDSAILPGTSFVAFPPNPLVERIGWKEAMKVIPVITVSSVADLDTDSNCPDLICNYDKEIAAHVSIRFLSDAERLQRAPPSIPNGNILVPSPGAPVTLASAARGKVLVVAEDDAKGAGGAGELQVTMCPASGTSTVFFYDDFPVAGTLLGAPLSYGAMESHLVFAADCCTEGASIPVAGVRVVVLRQNDPQPHHINEIEIFASANPTVNIAPEAKCYLLPSTGTWYNGQHDGLQPRLNDEDLTGTSHSGVPHSGGGKDFAMCVLQQAVELSSVKIVPSSTWSSRNQNYTLELYADVAMGDLASNMGPVKAVGKLWQRLVEHSGVWYNGGDGETYTVPSLSALPSDWTCEANAGPQGPTFTFPAAHGKSYAIVDATAAGTAVTTSVEHSTCPGTDATLDFSYPTPEPGGTQSCHPCPSKALDRTGIEACPSDSVACDLIHVPGPGGGLFQARGSQGGRTR